VQTLLLISHVDSVAVVVKIFLSYLCRRPFASVEKDDVAVVLSPLTKFIRSCQQQQQRCWWTESSSKQSSIFFNKIYLSSPICLKDCSLGVRKPTRERAVRFNSCSLSPLGSQTSFRFFHVVKVDGIADEAGSIFTQSAKNLPNYYVGPLRLGRSTHGFPPVH
jgi:hypothetical protein